MPLIQILFELNLQNEDAAPWVRRWLWRPRCEAPAQRAQRPQISADVRAEEESFPLCHWWNSSFVALPRTQWTIITSWGGKTACGRKEKQPLVHQAITTATLTFPPEDQNSSECLKSWSRWKCQRWAWAKPHHFPTTRHQNQFLTIHLLFPFSLHTPEPVEFVLGKHRASCPSHPELPSPPWAARQDKVGTAGRGRLAQKAFGVHLHICTATAPRLVWRSFPNNKGTLLI